MNVAVVGMGKIGVPLAVQIARKGASVAGYDRDEARVATINARRNPIAGEPQLDELLPGLVATGRLRATTDPKDAVAAADVLIFIVPVDIDDMKRADFALLDDAVSACGPYLQRGALVIVETTVPVGTTRYRVGARLAEACGLRPTADFSLAFSPERVSSGSVLRDLRIYPKIVGGIDAHSTARAVDLYRQVLDADEVRPVRDAETAEFTKLIETTYRDVNIALANEFAMLADRLGVDALQAIDAANSQPYSHIHAPGPGVGGHCIPVYPYFLASPGAELISSARRINDEMATYSAERLREAMGSLSGATVLLLGLAYRPGVKESRHSSALTLAQALGDEGARVLVHDPLFTPEEIAALGLDPSPPLPCAADAIAIQAWHAEYETLDLRGFEGLRAVLDPRASLDPEQVRTLGLTYVGVGR